MKKPIPLPNLAKPRDADRRQLTATINSAAAKSKADKLLRKFSWETDK
jgi:hypothetical protein